MGNHLWQSTLCLVIVGLLTLVFRKNHARVRYGLWLAASVKFLIPFSLLIVIGSHLARPRVVAPAEPGFFFGMQEIGQPFAPPAAQAISPVVHSTTLANVLPAILVAMWFCGFVAVLFVWGARWRRVSAVLRDAAPSREGREVDALRRVERRLGIRKPIDLLMSPATLEPGIFGIVKLNLVWPKGISARLDDAQLEAILGHELWHVRRRDNLAAAIHMVVEALFWFHPLVWWLGARLLDERELACDEKVLESGSDRQVYAESILKTCDFCVESPLACVSGVTGADLKNRIVRIMTERMADKLSFGRKLLLAGVGVVTVIGPVLFGLVNSPQIRAQSPQPTAGRLPSFEVASIKLSDSHSPLQGYHIVGDRFNATKPAEELIEIAYGRNGIPLSSLQISGGPGWINSDSYDINAKVDDPFAEGEWKNLSFERQLEQVDLMLQSLLVSRFKLRIRHETKELPVWGLVLDKKGPKFPEDNSHLEDSGFRVYNPGGGEVGLSYTSSEISRFASFLSVQRELNPSMVVDKTGLHGHYSFKIHWLSEPPLGLGRDAAGAAPSISSGPSLFTALRDQLGLKLEPTKGPVEVIVIDHVERPSEN